MLYGTDFKPVTSIFELLKTASETYKEPGWLSCIALNRVLDDRGFESRQELGIFLFTTASRSVLVPTQPPMHWVLGGSFPGGKAAGV
jgi:hypothetical protein